MKYYDPNTCKVKGYSMTLKIMYYLTGIIQIL